jgi:hypothetical protein
MNNVTSWLDIVNKYGPVVGFMLAQVAAVGFFIWRDWKRESFLLTRIESLEKEMREKLYPLAEECKGVLSQAITVIERNTRIIESWFFEKAPRRPSDYDNRSDES